MSILLEALMRAFKTYNGASPRHFVLLAIAYIYNGDYKGMFTVLSILSLTTSIDVLVAFRWEYNKIMKSKMVEAKVGENDQVLKKEADENDVVMEKKVIDE